MSHPEKRECYNLQGAIELFPPEQRELILELCAIKDAAWEKNCVGAEDIITAWVDRVGVDSIKGTALYQMLVGGTLYEDEWPSLPIDTPDKKIERFIREELRLDKIPVED